ncbi:hypothetical protein ACH41E_17065 [Streptomyces sp. NPDC020412]|uniref:hypothetical protein n=1 Tax=Streptomyces sp. NPDC020412 TaxID=3365073 RepID=UPI0037BC6BAC
MRKPVTGKVHVHYGQIYVHSDPDNTIPDLSEAFAGQRVGLCGAAVPGTLWLVTALHTGDVDFTVEIHDEAPPLHSDWQDVVEVSFRPMSERTSLVQWAGEAAWNLDLILTDYRVRYCAQGMDEGRGLDTTGPGEPRAERYLLQFWPAPPSPDHMIRQTSHNAAYWHRYARELPPPPTPEQRAEAEHLAHQAEQQAAEEQRLHREQWEWGGRLPSEGLRGARESNVLGLLRFDSDLVHALDAAGPEVQRAVALLAARRACEVAGLTDVLWVAEALAELAEERPLPPPFDDTARMWETLRSDPSVPGRSVRQATPPERAPYHPPTTPGAEWTWAPDAELGNHGPHRPGLGRALGALVLTASSDERPTPPAEVRRTAAVEVHATGTPRVPEQISQPHFALPAVLAAAEPAPLKAALDAVWHAVNTYGEHYPELLEEIWSASAEETEE